MRLGRVILVRHKISGSLDVISPSKCGHGRLRLNLNPHSELNIPPFGGNSLDPCDVKPFTCASATATAPLAFVDTVPICCAPFKLSKMVQKDAEQESEMRAEIQEMKKEQASISMMDEFARYARLERKINKMTDRLKTHGERDERLSQPSEPRQRLGKPSRVKWQLIASTKTLLVSLN